MQTPLALIVVVLMLAVPVSPAAGNRPPIVHHPIESPDARQDHYDYVIVVGSNDLVNAIQPLVAWKTSLGFGVRVVTLEEIYSQYPTGDDAERIWEFLADRYPASEWGFHYLLLIGDVDLIPQRILYPDGDANDGGEYPTDYYYANLDAASWDDDGDNRWGEFTHDALDTAHEVVVGRLPLNDPVVVQTVSANIVAFEQDTGAWKRSALFAHGMMDYVDATVKTDCAEVSELLRQDVLDPLGWTYEMLYEGLGLQPSSHVGPTTLSQASFQNECGASTHGLINAMAHGNPNTMISFVWAADPNRNGIWDPGPRTGELNGNSFSHRAHVPTHPASSIVYLCGCDTGQIMDRDPAFHRSPLRSRYLVRIPKNDTMLEAYLLGGAPAVIGATRGSGYRHAWDALADGGQQSLNYYFMRNLIDDGRRAGDAFFDAQQEFADAPSPHGLERGIRVFNYYGDPALALRGIDDRPGGPDVLVHEGYYFDFGADHDDNGDMYVAAVATSQAQSPGVINVYRSTDHGQTWAIWSVTEHETPIQAVDVALGRWTDRATNDERLLIFYSAVGGRLWVDRIDLGNPLAHDVVFIAQNEEHDIERLAVSREPGAMPDNHHLHVAWEVTSSSSSRVRTAHSADNGTAWDRYETSHDYFMPHVEAGLNGLVLLVASYAFGPDHVAIKRSTDHGQSWSAWTDLTTGDGAGTTDAHYHPVVAASTDPAHSAVWAAYEWVKTGTTEVRELHGAVSTDWGASWSKFRTIASVGGTDATIPDLEAYSSAPNQWVNLAYNQQAHSGTARLVIWRHASGGTPRTWSHERIENDTDAAWSAPEIIYSPGASVPGSGVLYGGVTRENIFFSAPWLGGPRTMAALDVDSKRSQSTGSRTAGGEAYVAAGQAGTPARASGPTAAPLTARDEGPYTWLETGDLAGAMMTSSIIRTDGTTLLAAACAQDPEGPLTGSVYRSVDAGETWERLDPLDSCISLTTVFETGSGTLLAGGTAQLGEDNPGIIYRSDNGGEQWSVVMEIPNGVVTDIVETLAGDLFAASGWDGRILRSDDDGINWLPAAELGADVHVHALLAASSNHLFAALAGPGATVPVMRSVEGGAWEATAGWPADVVPQQFVECGDRIYAGVEIGGGGVVFEADLDGAVWQPLPEPAGGDTRVIRSVACGPHGELFAGAGMGLGPSSTTVFVRPPGGGDWETFGGLVDVASIVYDVLVTEEMVYLATGHIYGNVYMCALDEVVGIGEESGSSAPPAIALTRSYPNPFRPTTTIHYELPSPAAVTLRIYGTSGRLVRTLRDGESREAGAHRIEWNGRRDDGGQAAAGTYFYRLTAGAYSTSGKMTLAP